MSDKRDKLSKKVLEFVKAQPGYNHQERGKIMTAFKIDTFTVIYGKNEMARIIGIGKELWYLFKTLFTVSVTV